MNISHSSKSRLSRICRILGNVVLDYVAFVIMSHSRECRSRLCRSRLCRSRLCRSRLCRSRSRRCTAAMHNIKNCNFLLISIGKLTYFQNEAEKQKFAKTLTF